MWFDRFKLNHAVDSAMPEGLSLNGAITSVYEPCPADVSAAELKRRNWLMSAPDEGGPAARVVATRRSIDLGASRPAVVDYQAPAIHAMAQAFEWGFGAPPVYIRGGGSLPIVADFQDILGVPIVLIGPGMPDDNTHAPKEKVHLPNLNRGIETLVYYFSILSTMPGQG